MRLLLMSLSSPFFVSLSLELLNRSSSICVLISGKRWTVHDLVVQAAQCGKELRFVQIEVPAIPLAADLDAPDCAPQHQGRPDPV
jgi:hypothetical protein